MGNVPNPKGPNPAQGRKLRARELEEKATELRMAGHSYYAIGKALGIGRGTVHKAVMRALKRLNEETREHAQQVLELELKRCDKLLASLWPHAIKGNGAAVDRVLRIMERRTRYLGLDSPVKHELTGQDGGPMELANYDFRNLSDDELSQVLKILRRASTSRTDSEEDPQSRSGGESGGGAVAV